MNTQTQSESTPLVAAAITTALIVMATPAAAQLSFADPGFENGGSTTQVDDANYNAYGKGNDPVSDYPAGIWNQWLLNDGDKGGILEDKDTHQDFMSYFLLKWVRGFHTMV